MKQLNHDEMTKINGGAKPPQQEIDAAKAALCAAVCPEGENTPTGPIG